MKRRAILATLAAISGAFTRRMNGQSSTDVGACFSSPPEVSIFFSTEGPRPCDPDALVLGSGAFGNITVTVDGTRYRITAADLARELAPFEVHD